MASVELNGAAIDGWDSFHAECKRAFGFPASYTNTMDAWVDCLSYLRDADGMSRFHLAENEKLDIVVKDAAAMRERAPELL
ncbi:MAG: barstar family protein, partial [Telluria sp.]